MHPQKPQPGLNTPLLLAVLVVAAVAAAAAAFVLKIRHRKHILALQLESKTQLEGLQARVVAFENEMRESIQSQVPPQKSRIITLDSLNNN